MVAVWHLSDISPMSVWVNVDVSEIKKILLLAILHCLNQYLLQENVEDIKGVIGPCNPKKEQYNGLKKNKNPQSSSKDLNIEQDELL